MKKEDEIREQTNEIKLELTKIDSRAFEPIIWGKAGIILFSMVEGYIEEGETVPFSTGYSIKIPKGYIGKFVNRNINFTEDGIYIALDYIENEYEGHIVVVLGNRGQKEYKIKKYSQLCELQLEKIVYFDTKINQKSSERYEWEKWTGTLNGHFQLQAFDLSNQNL